MVTSYYVPFKDMLNSRGETGVHPELRASTRLISGFLKGLFRVHGSVKDALESSALDAARSITVLPIERGIPPSRHILRLSNQGSVLRNRLITMVMGKKKTWPITVDSKLNTVGEREIFLRHHCDV